MEGTHDTRATGPRRTTAGPQNVFSAISWALLITIMFGGYSLLRLLSSGDGLTEHEEQFFRAGHGHAGVLATLGILYGGALGRTLLTTRRQVIAWSAYLAGVLLMSGGMFVHMMIGEPGHGSAGTTITAIGGVVLAITVVYLAWHLFGARHVEWGPVPTSAQSGTERS